MTLPQSLNSMDVSPLLSSDPASDKLSRAWSKRALDILGALGGLVLLSPLLLIVALVVAIDMRGSPLFRQRRCGHMGRTFTIYKFQTMRVREDGNDVVQVRPGDSRVTEIGWILRRYSIDELPQLINVLKGEMSLVGPRPHVLLHDEYYGSRIEHYAERYRAKPGLTGLAQIRGLRGATPEVSDMAARVAKDLEYIRDWSFFTDLEILMRTVLELSFRTKHG